nr:reverse transcriptase domain-containing protein [Tanacetum cinerariifolium]
MGDTPVETQQTPIVDQPSTSKPQRKQKPPRKQRKEAKVSHDESQDEEHVPTPSSDPLPSGEDSFTLNEFMVFCTNLQEQIGLGRRMKSPMEKDSLGAQEDASKQGRIIKEINKNVEISLDDETQGRTNDDDMFGVDDLADEEVVMDTRTVTTTVKVSVAPTIDVTEDEITMAQALARLKSAKLKIVVQEQKKSTTIPTAAKTVTTTVTTPRAKDKNVKPVIDDTEELKKCMEIVPDDEDEMLIEATPLSSKSPTIIDYKIHKEVKKTYFKIIRAYSNSQVYQTFEKMFKNFNREDLEVMWSIVKDIFKKKKPDKELKILFIGILKGRIRQSQALKKINSPNHGITNLELIKRMHDNIPKSLDEITWVTAAFFRGEVAASNQARKKALLA